MKPVHLLAALCLIAPPVLPAAAQTPPPVAAVVQPAPAMVQQAEKLPAIINGTGDYESYFASAFKTQIPRAQFDQIGVQLKAQFGAAIKVEKIIAASPYQATVLIGFERGIGTIDIVVDSALPHPVTGLRFAKVEPRDDSVEKVEADLRALPGTTAFGIYALGDAATPVSELRGDQPMPIGSAFKLWVLAEAARQVNSGARKWSDIVTLGPRSLPSGVTQSWPKDAPVTLHTLATLMISISDNTATDTLLTALGRERVDAMVTATGVANPAATLPVLTTIEAFRLKSSGNADIAAAWKAAGADGRRRLLRDNATRLGKTQVDPAIFGDKPVGPDVEWFASARDEAAVLNWLRTRGGQRALDILAVNPGLPSATQFDYAGFKGGSEPGVIFGSWLVRTKQGNWFAVTGGWNRPDGAVDQTVFINLMNRLLSQLAAR
ncbi:serine hydrolase [Sphingomonas sp. LT1P40]|uniref:serine hydrolase n=1 Tax=Alteristakelama amylovorans TaxID=3096166 RepID=UPI002FC7BE4F